MPERRFWLRGMMSESDCKSLAEKIAPAAACDVRPCATIRIGAIGHRNIDDTNGKIAGTVKTVLRLVRRSAEEALKQPDVRERFADAPDLVIVSPLAEGADRLIAQAGIELNCRLGRHFAFRYSGLRSDLRSSRSQQGDCRLPRFA